MLAAHFIELGIAYLLAVMMPGPSIALIIRNGIVNSRMASVKAALGIIIANLLQSGVVLAGFTFLDSNALFLKTIKMLCSLFLIYLGLKILFARKTEKSESIKTNISSRNTKRWGYFWEGFLIDFLNPLAFTFFISIMTVIISPQESWLIKVGYWIEIILISIIWFLGAALVLSSERINLYTKKFHKILEIIAGAAFIFFGVKMFI
jgi:threonine efflux protein